MKIYYENILPHLLPPGATFHVTFRLFDSLPQTVLISLKNWFELEVYRINKAKGKGKLIEDLKHQLFGKYENQLDMKPYGSCYLKQKSVAEILARKILSYNDKYYDLIAMSIMPNHAHLLIDTSIQLTNETEDLNNYVQLNKIMQYIKGGSSFLINRYLNRKGTLWQRESFDRYIRNENQLNTVKNYILQNPVKANLNSKFTQWPYRYEKL